ncbi:hypothetical protein [Roseateles violae]|uniref:Type IV pilus assembly protein PilO n=1 Tax=Roseateles violae TaxID=3058042 RepID=A0ABT8DRK9_9BURK|nr:hypothetical protein [Pelomonas sp. PFR6]MDN3920967.1 hypothetical protein [Pelomonas sp. PFR6]
MTVGVEASGDSTAIGQGLSQIRAELRGNVRLRLGLFLIAATLWIWLVMLLQDQAQVWRGEADEARVEMERLKPLQSAGQWVQRAEEAHKHLETAKSMMWSAASQGLAEAALQDTLRSWSEKAGLPVRELTVSASPGANGLVGANVYPLRARLVVDMNRFGLMALLAELGRSPQVMVVESLRLRPVAQPARAELEVRVLFRNEERRT